MFQNVNTWKQKKTYQMLLANEERIRLGIVFCWRIENPFAHFAKE
jgi:hypothetical protein